MSPAARSVVCLFASAAVATAAFVCVAVALDLSAGRMALLAVGCWLLPIAGRIFDKGFPQ